MIYLRIYKFSDRLCINILTMNTVVIVILNNQITLGKHAIAPQPCSNNLMPETIIAQSITKDSGHVVVHFTSDQESFIICFTQRQPKNAAGFILCCDEPHNACIYP